MATLEELLEDALATDNKAAATYLSKAIAARQTQLAIVQQPQQYIEAEYDFEPEYEIDYSQRRVSYQRTSLVDRVRWFCSGAQFWFMVLTCVLAAAQLAGRGTKVYNFGLFQFESPIPMLFEEKAE